MSKHSLKESMLGEFYEYSLPDIADKLFMHVNTASNLERSAIIKFKAEFEAKGYKLTEVLP